MKLIFGLLAAFLASFRLQAADGYLNFINFSTTGGVNARVIYDSDLPNPLNGKLVETASGLVAQLFLVGTAGSLTPLFPVSSFKTGIGAGVWDLKLMVVPDAAPNMTFRVRVFESGRTFDTSFCGYGESANFTATPGISPASPGFLRNLTPFAVWPPSAIPCPEPSTWALNLLGAVGLFALRSTKP